MPSRLIKTPADERAVSLGYFFDERAAEAVAVFSREFCRHPQGRWAGEQFDLADWQYLGLIEPLYGWKRPDGSRRHRRCGAWIPKKNGKSTTGSMLSTYHLVGDGEQGAVVGNVGVDRDQASIVFDAAASMVRSSPELSAVLDVVDSRKTIVHPASGSKYFAMSADVASKEGLNLSALIQDELHRWRPEMFTTLYHAGAARRQPMFISISTAGVYDPGSVGWQQYQYAKGVLSGTIEDLAFFPFIHEADPADDWTAPSTWAKANPSLGVTLTTEEIAEQCEAAQHSVGLENAFKRYRLNLWTQSTERWLPLTTWDCSAGHEIVESVYVGKKFYGGIDVGAVSDLTIAALLFQCPHDPAAIDVVIRAFLPAAALREGRNADLYSQWARDKFLLVTAGEVSDESVLVQAVVDDAAMFGCHSIGIDRLFQAMRISVDLAGHGLEVAPCGMGSMALSPLVDELERLILSGKFHHGGHPILRAAVDAVEMEVDSSGNRKPSRSDRSKKIDALVAVLIALDRKLRAPAQAPAPEYSITILGGRR